MSLPKFLQSLFHEGRVAVEPIFDAKGDLIVEGPRELNDSAHVLKTFEMEYRHELAHTPPPLDSGALLWGAKSLHRAASLLTYREVDADRLRHALAEPCRSPPSPSVVYSVDLCFRFLPDLMRLARAASSEDPLVPILKQWGEQWPLSSVGMQLSVTGTLDWLIDPCLRQLYVDRILAEQDESRLADPTTHKAILESLGRHQHLAPKLTSHLVAK